ncbi:biopolymer transporter ExbD [candidate division CSSED10-310 bacterium]|uniref:Biopolymer transporter ExbD n=1 Tax=candidate division CSSED10-310 bacterium TaxID=2855610 RepID=A0ABV6YUQ0_UNCC1
MSMNVGEGGGDVSSDINVTPLVDVCLVLLIIFMVVTPMLQNGVPVELPKAKSVIDKPDDDSILQVVLDRNLTVYVRENKIGNLKSKATLDDLRRRMFKYFRDNPAEYIQIKADKNQRYGHVKHLMRLIQETGMKETTLVADEVEPPA